MGIKALVSDAALPYVDAIRAETDDFVLAALVGRIVEEAATRAKICVIGPDHLSVEDIASEVQTDLGDPTDDEGAFDSEKYTERLLSMGKRSRV